MKKCLQIAVCVLIGVNIFAQNDIPYIYGKVVDKEDIPIPHVHIKNRYTGEFTVTDMEGKYKIYMSANRMHVLEFSYIGAEKQVKEFYFRKGDKREMNVVLFDIHKIIDCKPPKKLHRRKAVRMTSKQPNFTQQIMTISLSDIKSTHLMTKRQ